ncbi:unnamed protein product [Fusarium graminearum]|uniref:Uncharacterized protein n=1 Tax=Gibberella zeae TaxID=5518 RepID=A0A4E9EKP2_GIBZA|nr:unnamed protein product [Fusarium graminearum]CAG1964090.1 unnamed protein product [Fusarium graminearum]
MRASDFVKATLPTFATYVAAIDNSGPLSLYAYGPDVGGMSLFSAGDAIYVGNFSRVDDVQAAPIQYKSTHSLTNIQHRYLIQFSHVFQ